MIIIDIQFKESPFYTIKETVSRITECPGLILSLLCNTLLTALFIESTGTSDRRTAGFDFHLNSDQVTRLTTPRYPRQNSSLLRSRSDNVSSSKTQLRLFCTSSVFYAGNNLYATNNVPCLIEFPPTCEVRINNVQLTANLKGLKKKPGTAPPPDIGKLTKFTGSNRVDMVYLNTQNQQGVPPKVWRSLVDEDTVWRWAEIFPSSDARGSHKCLRTGRRGANQV